MRPTYVSTGTESFSITPVNVQSYPYTTLPAVSANASSCSPDGSGGTLCSVAVAVPIGEYQFEVLDKDGSGDVLATTFNTSGFGFPSSQSSLTVTETNTAIASVTLSPVPTSIAVSIGRTQAGVASSPSIALTAFDATGAQIAASNGAAMYSTATGLGAVYVAFHGGNDPGIMNTTGAAYTSAASDPLAVLTEYALFHWPLFASPQASLSLAFSGAYSGVSDGGATGYDEPVAQFGGQGEGDAPLTNSNGSSAPHCGAFDCVSHSFRILEDDAITSSATSINFASTASPPVTISLNAAANATAGESVAESFSCGAATLAGAGTQLLTITPAAGMPSSCALYVYSNAAGTLGLDATSAVGYAAVGVPATIVPVTVGGAQPPDVSLSSSDIVLSGSPYDIVVTPAAGYTGVVSLVPVACWSDSGSFNPQTQMPASNGSTVDIVNAATPSSIITTTSGSSVGGSPVTLTVTPHGKGMCFVATSPAATGLGTSFGKQVIPLLTVSSE